MPFGLGARARALVLVAAAALPPVAGAAPIEIAWDKDVAFDYDRESYQRQLREIVERSYEFASTELRMTLPRPLPVTVYTRKRYEQQFGTKAAFERGGHYSRGGIHVNGGSRLDDAFAGGMVHEMTHALLDHHGTSRQLPLWVNEGLAELLSYRRRGQDALAPSQIAALQYEVRQKTLVPLPTWGRVKWNYLQCYAAALFLERKAGRDGMLAVVRRALDGETFERALDRELRWTFQDLEREFVTWVEHLP
jgi:hypothetical protein